MTTRDPLNGKLNADGFRELFPVCQSTHTGKFGWRRVNGCINLNACHWATEAEAEADRDSNLTAWIANPGDFSL